MKHPHRRLQQSILFLLAGLALVSVARAASILDFLTSRNDFEAITVTDVTPAGLLRRPPSPSNPIYYLPISSGYHDLGGTKGGEKPVARELVNKIMLKALAKQGFLPATENHPATLVLVWNWGTLNVVYSFAGPGAGLQMNHRQMLRFIGATKSDLGSRYDDPFPELTLMPGLFFNMDGLDEAASDDLYIATISAYEPNSTDRKPVLLWNTRISCPARGSWLPEAMPTMLAIATPFIGRETSKPMRIRASEKFKPEVILGDPKLVEYLESSRAPVIDFGPSK